MVVLWQFSLEEKHDISITKTMSVWLLRVANAVQDDGYQYQYHNFNILMHVCIIRVNQLISAS